MHLCCFVGVGGGGAGKFWGGGLLLKESAATHGGLAVCSVGPPSSIRVHLSDTVVCCLPACLRGEPTLDTVIVIRPS